MSEDKKFYCDAAIEGRCTIYVMAKNKKEAKKKIDQGYFEVEESEWETTEIYSDDIHEED